MTKHSIYFRNIERSIALLSDVHAGSDLSVYPVKTPIYELEGTKEKNLTLLVNGGQRLLYDHWQDFIRQCNAFRVDTVVTVGDLTDGTNPKECNKKHLMTTDLNVQTQMAVELLKPLVKNRKYHGFSGTDYHGSKDYAVHQEITNNLKEVATEATFWSRIGNIKFTPTTKVANIAHKATGATIYPATALDRERVFLKMAEGTGKLPKIDAFIRGHLHFYFHLDYADMHIVQLPAWKAWFPMGDAVRLYGKMQPDIGGVIMIIDKENRMMVFHFLYELPHILDRVLEG